MIEKNPNAGRTVGAPDVSMITRNLVPALTKQFPIGVEFWYESESGAVSDGSALH
jgi:hypothetical protein